MVRSHVRRGCITVLSLAALFVAGCGDQAAKLALGAQCELSSECGAPLVCRLDRCRDECVTNRDCVIDSYCVFDKDGLGACVLPQETRCNLASECPDPLTCTLSRCTNECVEDRDCPAGHRCTDRACVDRAEEVCASSRDCDPPLVCAIDGRCRAECISSRDCRGGTVCDSGVCMRASAVDGGPMDGGPGDAGVDGAAPADGGGGAGDGGGDGAVDAGAPDGASPPWIVLSLEPFSVFTESYRPFGAGSWQVTPRVPEGSPGVPVSLVHLVNAHDRVVTVSGVDLQVSGDPAALGAVRLWQDVNVNGRVDPVDVALDEVTAIAASPVALRFSHPIAALGDQYWLLEVDVAAGAAEGTTSLEIASHAAVTSDADRFEVVGSTSPLPLALGGVAVTARQAGTASLAVGPGNPAAATVAPADERVPALHLQSDNRTGWVRDRALTERGNDIDAVGAVAMVAGQSGAVYRTEDGGATWATLNVGAAVTLDAISMADADTAYAVGSLGNAFVTLDGGSSWASIPDAGSNLHGVHALSATEAWAVGSGGRVVSTTDGGTWTPVAVGAGSRTLHDVHFVDSSNGWIVGASGTIAHTATGGASWSLQTSGVTAGLRDVFFVDASEGWVVGDSGTILHTIDGGATWARQTACGSGSFQGVHVPDGVNGFALGSTGSQCATADGGATWTSLASPTTTVYAVRCTSADASQCLAATLGGPARTSSAGLGETSFSAVRLHIGGTAPLSAIDAVALWSSSAGGAVLGTSPLNEVRRPRSRDVLLYWAPREGDLTAAMATFDVAAGASAGTVILSIEDAADVLHLVDPLTAAYPLRGEAQTIAP